MVIYSNGNLLNGKAIQCFMVIFSFVKDVFCLLGFHRNRASVILRTANCHCVLSYERESYNPQFRGALGRDGIVASVG